MTLEFTASLVALAVFAIAFLIALGMFLEDRAYARAIRTVRRERRL